MPTVREPDRRNAPARLAGLAVLACLGCCILPARLAAGIIGGAGWIALGRALPALAVGLAAATWWWTTRRPQRHRAGCASDDCCPGA